jgi:cardiolipin synthase
MIVQVVTFWELIKDIWPHIYPFVYWGYVTLVALIIIIIIADNKNPAKTMAWILVLVFLPVAGIIVYLFFGQNFRKQKIFSRKGLEDFRQLDKMRFEQLELLNSEEAKKIKPVFKKLHIMKLLLNNSKSIISQNNNIYILNNGTEKFPALLEALKQAKHHIHFEYYIFEHDNIGKQIISVLQQKAKEGVKVKIIIDHVGSWHFSNRRIKQLRKKGVEIRRFMRVNFPYFTSKVNYRNHRKIVVIDGHTGFVGGMNIADKYIHGTKKLGNWRDLHLKIHGEAVHSLQTVFLMDWYFITKELPTETSYFPKIAHDNKKIIQIVSSGPDSSWAGIMQTYFLSIATARKSIYITTPYLLPNSSILTALKTASLSGVDVKLIIPKKSDSVLVSYASLSFVGELIDAGIEVYFYKKGFIHSKTMIIDSILSSLGTANLDYRSISVNFEINALIYDEETALKLTKSFNKDITDSELVTKEIWIKKPITRKLQSSIARIFSPLL